MRLALLYAALLSAAVVWQPPAQADAVRTQTVTLRAGWNAVYLEVFPSKADPSEFFAGTPVEIAASFYPAVSSAQFVSNPNADLFRAAGWGVWYAPSRPDSFLTDLHGINGQQAYLVYSKSDFLWQITGTVTLPDTRWQANSFNLVGFSVDATAPPTFAQFFAGSKAHQHNRIYRLNNGVWRRVTDPSAENMRSGEAFWIYSDGASRYQGPLKVETDTRQGLVLRSGVKDLVIRNQTDHPVTATVSQIKTGQDWVPLSVVVTAVGDKDSPVRSIPVARPDDTWAQVLPPLEKGGAVRVPFQLRRQDQHTFAQTSLLKISSDMGAEVWVPVFSVREDLEDK